MTAEERVKVRDWARRNLGKEVTIIDTNIAIRTSKAMVVGYSEFRVFGEEVTNVLVSFTNHAGWGPGDLDLTDHVFVHSPLNVSFWMVNLCDIDGYAEQE
jgi:hypothetical protein